MAMMNFNEISKVSTADKPSELVARYLLHEQAGGTLYEFLAQFDFASREEIALAVRDLAYTIVGDKYITDKRTQENNVFARCIFRRFNSICTNPDKFDKYPISVSGELWHGGYSRKKIQQASLPLTWQKDHTSINLRMDVQLPTIPTNRPAAEKTITIGSSRFSKGTKVNSFKAST